MKKVYKLANLVLLRAFVFVAMIVMGTGMAKADYVLDKELTWDQVKGGTQAFALVSGNDVLYGTTQQNLAFGDASIALAESNSVVLWKVESEGSSVFYFRGYNLAGNAHTAYGSPAYLNSQPNIGGVTFVLNNKSDKFTGGQDMDNGAVWTVTAVSGGYTIRNTGNNGYLAGATTTSTVEKVWKFYSVKVGTVTDIYGSDAGTDSGLRPIRRYGKNLVYADDVNTPVVLHGVMDTPSAYFNVGRWTNGVGWADYNNTANIAPCLNYFTKIFEAINNPSKGTYCNLFRLHLDPCWVQDDNLLMSAFQKKTRFNSATNKDETYYIDPHGKEVGGEANVARFSVTKFRARLQDLYIPIIKDAIAHGLYVIVRPPGVFPEDVVVGDYYNEYLKTIWDIVSSDSYIKAHAGQISFELGNEPVHIWEKGTTDFSQAYGQYNVANRTDLYDFFQPMVDIIRANGFKGIIWSSGTGYQAEYQSYSKKMLNDSNLGFAAHFYPGWYNSTSNDEACKNSDANVLNQFKTQLPIQASHPIVITEVDWSPKDGAGGHYDEHGSWVVSNYGTWGTGSTTTNSRFGEQYKYVVDQCGNVSWTLQGSPLYVDIDAYLKDGTVQPAFLAKAKANNVDIYEACSGATFKWFREYAGGTVEWTPSSSGGSSATYKLGNELTWDEVKDGKTPFVLVQNGYALGKIGSDLLVAKIEDLTESDAFLVKVEEGAGALAGNYYFNVLDNSEADQGYMNASVWSHAFLSGKNSDNGEKTNGLLWTVTKLSDGKYSIRNLGVTQGSYNVNTDGTPSADKSSQGYLTANLDPNAYWKFHPQWTNSTASGWQFYSIKSADAPVEDDGNDGIDLAKDMFHKWTAADATGSIVNETVYPAYVLNESTSLPYGDGNVDYLHYTDLSDYGKLVVTATEGTPRFLMNRDIDNGSDPDHLINIPNNATQTAKYMTSADGVYTIDIAKIVEDYGYCHLHSIKGLNGNVTVTSMKLLEIDNCLKVTTTEARKEVWDWQVRYPLPQALESGKAYTIEIVAKAANETNIGVWPVVSSDESKLQYGGINVATEWTTQSFETNGANAYDYLFFNIGKVGGDFMISNIKITDKSTGAVVLNNNMNDNSTWTRTQNELTVETVSSDTEAEGIPSVPSDDDIAEEPTYGDATPVLASNQRRPVNNKNPMWLMHVDVWNQADPQKIIDLIPDDIKPYVVMNLSLSCSYNKELGVYERPQDAIKTYKSWGSVCQQNGMWFTCQPASGGHTHIMDDDLETFEYFFKTYPNFLGWNYAEQFWGFNEAGDKSSTTEETRIALFAKLIPMHHKYGGFLTISFCGSEKSHALNPVGMLKRNADLLKASEDYPESILWLYKYTHPVAFYNNESVTFGPFVAGLTKNYGVRYDNCGYNDAMSYLYPRSEYPSLWTKRTYGDGYDCNIKYPTAAGIGTVMEQMAQNGGAVWDGPELIWTEDFQNLDTSNVNGYTQRNWGTFPGFRNIWIDMFRKVIDGTIYIPTQKEVQAKTKIAIVNDVTSGTIEDKYGTWGDLYDNLYKVNDPLNTSLGDGNGQMQNNLSYQKSTGRYGTIPMMPELYSAEAKAIPTQVKKSQRWATLDAKKAAFDAAYPEVSTGDLFVSRYKNQLVTYNPYSNLGKTATNKRSASGHVPLRFNTCQSMDLTWANYSSAIVKEYSDKVYFYLNNYRTDTIAAVVDKIVINGASSKPSYTMTKRQEAEASATETWSNNVYTLEVSHMGPVDLTINCAGNATEGRWTNAVSDAALSTPVQPNKFVGTIIKEAEDMNYKSIQACIDNYIDQDRSIRGHSGNGIMKMGTNTNGGLTTNVKTNSTESYNVTIRYSNTDKAGNINLSVGGTTKQLALEKTAVNEWKKATVAFDFTEGDNTFKLDNNNGIGIWVDQVEFTPASIAAEEYDIVLGTPENGSVTADKTKATEGTIVTLTVTPKTGYALDGWAMGKTKVNISQNANGTYSFTMPDNVVTLTPIFKDVTVVYQLDFASTVNSSLPEGWRTIDGTEVREYPHDNYGQGPRIFSAFTGKYTHALYWRNTSADYGKLADYPLNLKAGTYKLSFRIAAWKGTPQYKSQILNADGSVLKTTDNITASPNAYGDDKADLSATEEKSFEFTVTEQGKYVINFVAQNGGEFMLLDCRINAISNGAGLVEPEPEPEPELAVQSNLTADMFYKWTAADATGEKVNNVGCAYELNVSTDMPYGDGSVGYLNYADLSNADKLYVTTTEGEPRFLFNRIEDNGTVNVELPRDKADYETVVENTDGSRTFVVDIKAIVADYGFAHLHAIKGANWANTTVSAMYYTLNVPTTDDELFSFDTFIASNGTFDRKEHSLAGDGGWTFDTPVDLTDYKYVVITSGRNRKNSTSAKVTVTFEGKSVSGDDNKPNGGYIASGQGLWLDTWNNNNLIVLEMDKFKNGEYDITKLNSLQFSVPNGDVLYINNVYATNTLPDYTNGDHVRTITEGNRYSTVCLPYDAAYSGCIVYEIAGKDDKDIYLNRIDGLMEAGKSYFFNSTENYEGNSAHKAIFYKAGSFEAPQPLASNGLVGTFKDGDNVPDNGKSYIVSNNQLWVVNEGTTVAFKANRAYINIDAVPAKSDVAGIRMRINGFDDESAIAAAEMTDVQVVAIYSASGVKQNSLQKGLNIVKMSDNSVKKIIIK